MGPRVWEASQLNIEGVKFIMVVKGVLSHGLKRLNLSLFREIFFGKSHIMSSYNSLGKNRRVDFRCKDEDGQ